MIIVKSSDKNRVYLAWLKSELYRVRSKLTDEEIRFIETPDMENEDENRRREQILLYKYGRIAILERLPSKIDWFETEIEQEDIDEIYIVPVWDWFLDTGKTFKMTRALDHMSKHRGHRIPDQPQITITHHEKVEKMFLSEDNPQDITMISSSIKDSPFTIIEGVHRSITLYKKNKLQGTKGFLGISDELSGCMWSIERTDMQGHINGLNQLVDAGIIW